MRLSLRTLWSVAASLNLLSTSAQEIPGNVAFPGKVEVELVFPRNDTYKTEYYFPVVFSISNPEVAEVLNLNVEFYVYDTNNVVRQFFALEVIDVPRPNLTSVASKTGPHLASEFIARDLDFEGAYEIFWRASWQSCTEGQNATTNYSKHSTFFSTKKSAPAVDLVAATRKKAICSTSNTTIGFDVLARHIDPNYSWETCAEVASPLLTPTPCEVEISSEAASSIAASTTSSLCSTVTSGSPPPRGISACPTPESSDAQKPLVGGVAWLLTFLVCVLEGLS